VISYPNPFNENLVLEWITSEKSFFKIQLYNVQGQLVQELPHYASQNGMNQINLLTAGYAPGLYTLAVTNLSSGDTVIKKMVKY